MADPVTVSGQEDVRRGLRNAEAWLRREIDVLVVSSTLGIESEAKQPGVAPVLTGALRANIHTEIRR